MEKRYIEELKRLRKMETEEEVEEFEKLIQTILERGNVEDISILVEGFDDGTECHDVMFGLVHAVDYYEGKASIEHELEILTKSIYKMGGVAEEWSEVLIYRILNNDEYRKEYRNAIKKSGKDVRDYHIKKLEGILEEDEELFRGKVEYVIKE